MAVRWPRVLALALGWVGYAGGALVAAPKAGRGLCTELARTGALCYVLCFEPDVEKNTKFTPQTHNTRQRNNVLIGCERSEHVPERSPGGPSASDPELRQHAETPVVVKAATIVAEAAVPTRGHTTATASEPSRMALREERAERRGTARTRRPLDVRGHLVRTPYCARENVPDSPMRRLRPAGTRRAQPRWINLGARHNRDVT